MPKKKLTNSSKNLKTSKEWFEILCNEYEGLNVKTSEELFMKRALYAVLELRECEELFMKNMYPNKLLGSGETLSFADNLLFSPFNYFKEIITDEYPNESISIKLGTEEIEGENDEFENISFIENEADMRYIKVAPLREKINKNSYSQCFNGVKFIIESPMGYEIELPIKHMSYLEKLHKDLGKYIELIDNCESIITVKDINIDFEFRTDIKFHEFNKDSKERNKHLLNKMKELKINTGDIAYKEYYVEKVERTNFGEIWNITTKDSTKKEIILNITIVEYPITFRFSTNKKFDVFTNKNDGGRNEILLEKMYELKIESPNHNYEDYIVEKVVKRDNNEFWYLGS